MLKELFKRADAHPEAENIAVAAIQAIAVGIFAAQQKGVIRATGQTIGEIESGLQFAVDMACAKFLESAPPRTWS